MSRQRPLTSLLATAIVLAGCGESKRPEPAAGSARPIAVQTIAVAENSLPATYEATGTVRARTSVAISSRLMAYATAVRVQAGDRVREGQPLAVLDARDLDSNLTRVQASRDELKGAIAEAEGSLAAARSQLELAEVTLGRMQELLNKRSVTTQEFDEAAARVRGARAAVDSARARRSQMDARGSQIEQEVRAATIQQGYSTITAPFAGTIMTRTVEPGTLAVPGTALFTLDREGTWRLEVSVEESRVPGMRVGQSVAVTIDGIDRTMTARIGEIVPAIDSAARTGSLKLDLPADAALRSGLFGRARFETGERKAMTIPLSSVSERGQLQAVMVAENNVARTRLVTLGASSNGQVEVLSGLNPGDNLISPVPPGLSDGAPVESRNAGGRR